MTEVIIVTSGGCLDAVYSTAPKLKVTYIDRDDLEDNGCEETCSGAGEDAATQGDHRRIRNALKRAKTMRAIG